MRLTLARPDMLEVVSYLALTCKLSIFGVVSFLLHASYSLANTLAIIDSEPYDYGSLIRLFEPRSAEKHDSIFRFCCEPKNSKLCNLKLVIIQTF